MTDRDIEQATDAAPADRGDATWPNPDVIEQVARAIATDCSCRACMDESRKKARTVWALLVPATAEQERRRIKSNLNVALAKLGVFNIYVELSEDASDVFIARWTAGVVPSGLSAGATGGDGDE